MEVRKESNGLKNSMVTREELAIINQFTKRALKEDEVYTFAVRLCDNEVDRDGERFPRETLEELAELFVGKSGIFDHEWTAKGQAARIYRTEVVEEEGLCSTGERRCYLKGYAYMLRGGANDALIEEIEGGIKKEVSVGCAMARSYCSVCGAEYGSCAHRKGVTYDGKLCLAVLAEPTDAYEFSFVAVPAQREAGVLKAMKGGKPMTLKELVERSGDGALQTALHTLEEDAAFGRAQRGEMEKEVVSLGLLLDFGASEAVLKKAAAALDGEALCAWRKEMREKAAELFPPQAQLPAAGSGQPAVEAAYMI